MRQVLARVAAMGVLAVLLLTMALGVAPNFDTRLVELGEKIWPGYAADLRADPLPPDCELQLLDEQIASCQTSDESSAPHDPFGDQDPFAESQVPAPEGPQADPFGDQDPFADPKAPAPEYPPADPIDGQDPPAEPQDAPAEPTPADPIDGQDPPAEPQDAPAESAPADPFDGQDPFAEPPEAPAQQPPADPFAGQDPFAEPTQEPAADPASDPFTGQDPFAESPASPSAAGAGDQHCQALSNLRERCQQRHAAYQDIVDRTTPATRGWRAVEGLVARLAGFPYWRQLLVLLVLGGAMCTTVQRSHIALRRARTRFEEAASQLGQLLAHVFLGISCVADWFVQRGSSAEAENPILPVLWAAGFALLAAINVWNLATPPPPVAGARTRVTRLLMAIPLFAYMSVISGIYFIFIEGHPSGQAIFLHKFVQHPSIYLGIGLYVWAGMMLSVTRVTVLGFALLQPWKLPPTIFAWLVGVLSAVPTAYTGASGIFVLAAGREIFDKLRRAGASRRLALAATAMSGSLGVVLRPCLVVVLIAVLNKQVTTDDLFGKGLLVFGLTAALFLLAMLLLGRGAWRPASPAQALPASLRASGALVPHLVVAGAVLLFYRLVLHTRVNEHTAAYVVPAVLLAVVLADRWLARQLQAPSRRRARGSAPRPARAPRPQAAKADLPSGPPTGWLLQVTAATARHVGALLVLMTASVGLGGVVERAELMQYLPADLGSPLAAMALLVVFLVIIGMLMEPLGAVVLVSVTLAGLAADNGIAPVHFWMVVLVAFELGYLTPPVAINQLLARQAVGPEAEVERDEARGIWGRYQHVLVPMGIMATALLLVAFGPLVL